jgi:hypothetical protein
MDGTTMNNSNRRTFFYGFALGIMLATISSYYHFCKPATQSVSQLFGIEATSAPTSALD